MLPFNFAAEYFEQMFPGQNIEINIYKVSKLFNKFTLELRGQDLEIFSTYTVYDTANMLCKTYHCLSTCKVGDDGDDQFRDYKGDSTPVLLAGHTTSNAFFQF